MNEQTSERHLQQNVSLCFGSSWGFIVQVAEPSQFLKIAWFIILASVQHQYMVPQFIVPSEIMVMLLQCDRVLNSPPQQTPPLTSLYLFFSDKRSVFSFQLTEQSIKDYNRGRDYLCDLASREGVPLFEDITEAMNCIITILTEQYTAS